MKISAIIPAYNSQKTIARAIDSVLQQTRPADEIIVVDDGSTDRTAQIVRSCGDKIRLIQQENAGVSVARNTGITAATGDWIAFLDADDEWLPDKLRLQTDHLCRNPDLMWTYCDFFQICGHRALHTTHLAENVGKFLKAGAYFEDYLQVYAAGLYAWTGTILVRREVFNTVGLFEPGMKIAQDTDLWLRIAYQYPKVGYVAEPLAIYYPDTPGSSMKINDSVDFMVNLIHRHEDLSRKCNRYDAFRSCITQMVQSWIRRLIGQKRYADIRVLMNRFGDYLPAGRFRREMRFRLLCPPLTSPVANAVMSAKKRISQRAGRR